MEQLVSSCMDFCEILYWGKGKVHHITCLEGREGSRATLCEDQCANVCLIVIFETECVVN
jgi:hypothetical protein